MQSEINLLDFQDAEPDILVHSNPAIQERCNKRFNPALKALCKKKGLDVEVNNFHNSIPSRFSFGYWILTNFKMQ